MRVLVLINEAKKPELLSGDLSSSLDLHYGTDPHTTDLVKPDVCIDLLFDHSSERIARLRELQAGIIVVDSMIQTCKQFFPDFIRLNGWPTLLQRPVWEAANGIGEHRKKAEEVFLLFGKKTEWVPDQPGFISSRVISSIINEAFYTLEERVSTEQEIDIAMKLGTNYPYGPFEWGEKIGLDNIYKLLAELGNEHLRYQPSSLLKQKALA